MMADNTISRDFILRGGIGDIAGTTDTALFSTKNFDVTDSTKNYGLNDTTDTSAYQEDTHKTTLQNNIAQALGVTDYNSASNDEKELIDLVLEEALENSGTTSTVDAIRKQIIAVLERYDNEDDGDMGESKNDDSCTGVNLSAADIFNGVFPDLTAQELHTELENGEITKVKDFFAGLFEVYRSLIGTDVDTDTMVDEIASDGSVITTDELTAMMAIFEARIKKLTAKTNTPLGEDKDGTATGEVVNVFGTVDSSSVIYSDTDGTYSYTDAKSTTYTSTVADKSKELSRVTVDTSITDAFTNGQINETDDAAGTSNDDTKISFENAKTALTTLFEGVTSDDIDINALIENILSSISGSPAVTPNSLTQDQFIAAAYIADEILTKETGINTFGGLNGAFLGNTVLFNQNGTQYSYQYDKTLFY